MYWATEGYLLERMRMGEVDTVQMEKDFEEMFRFWKKIFMRGGGKEQV